MISGCRFRKDEVPSEREAPQIASSEDLQGQVPAAYQGATGECNHRGAEPAEGLWAVISISFNFAVTQFVLCFHCCSVSSIKHN